MLFRCLLSCFLVLCLQIQAQRMPPKAELVEINGTEDFPNIRDYCLSPNGKERYFTVESYKKECSVIVKSVKKGKKWSRPQVASFSGQFRDLEPFMAPDGLSLYFASERATAKSAKPNVDIWRVTRPSMEADWSAPERLDNVINSPENEYYPAITNSGNLYFTRMSEDPSRKEDIYLAEWENGSFQQPVALDTGVNGNTYEYNAFVAPDESYILFTSYGREEEMGGSDLYISCKTEEGHWAQARHLGKFINSNKIDYCPFYDPESGYLYFSSERSEMPKFMNSRKNMKEMIELFHQKPNGLSRIYRFKFDPEQYREK